MIETTVIAGMAGCIAIGLFILAYLSTRWNTPDLSTTDRVFYIVAGIALIGFVIPETLSREITSPTITASHVSFVYVFASVTLVSVCVATLFSMDPRRTLSSISLAFNQNRK